MWFLANSSEPVGADDLGQSLYDVIWHFENLRLVKRFLEHGADPLWKGYNDSKTIIEENLLLIERKKEWMDMWLRPEDDDYQERLNSALATIAFRKEADLAMRVAMGSE